MKKLIKDRTSVLSDMIEGLKLSNSDIEIIEDTVVVRKEKKAKGVALVSGGGSGHEPAHAGYVAKGMLDAAVCGEIFTSPTPDKVLAAIKAVDNGDGVLLIVKNYAGDVMNFEMAQEMAEMEGIQVETVIVRDDISIEDVEKRRGVAGTVIAHKYAGYLSEQGLSLSEIKDKVEQLLVDVKSIGMALTAPMIPSTGQNGFDIQDDEMEIGIGIHGEKGLQRKPVESVDKIVEQLGGLLLKQVESKSVIVMINGMGATPLTELNIVVKYVHEYFQSKGVNVEQWLVGDYMTSLNMEGFSITIVPSHDELLAALNAHTESRYF